MAEELTAIEVRVLGALVEKEATTPEYYPLSVNALMNGCNQKSNREPVMHLDEDAVRQALRTLSDKALVRSAGGESRVAKYEHRLSELYNFHRHETAVLCVLMLRGAQTPGELRTRSERMYAFEDLESVNSALNHLMRREPPLVKVLPRRPGMKEARYMHLLSGDAPAGGFPEDSAESVEPGPASRSESADGTRLAELVAEVEELKKELRDLKERFAEFQKQFQ